MDRTQIQSILHLLGQKTPPGSQLVLIGGSALALLGSPRPTIDIDFIGDDLAPNEFHSAILQIAQELKIYMEAIPLERFIPLPQGNQERSIHIGQFGNLEVFVADPYSIALSKVERGFDTDFDDLIFLIHGNWVDLETLEQVTHSALVHAREFDMDTIETQAHLEELKRRLK